MYPNDESKGSTWSDQYLTNIQPSTLFFFFRKEEYILDFFNLELPFYKGKACLRTFVVIWTEFVLEMFESNQSDFSFLWSWSDNILFVFSKRCYFVLSMEERKEGRKHILVNRRYQDICPSDIFPTDIFLWLYYSLTVVFIKLLVNLLTL